MFNVQLLLLSGVGKPYDPLSNEGVVGRNFTHQAVSESVVERGHFEMGDIRL
jgi:gluconate 2-dehydrogenase alpha chain